MYLCTCNRGKLAHDRTGDCWKMVKAGNEIFLYCLINEEYNVSLVYLSTWVVYIMLLLVSSKLVGLQHILLQYTVVHDLCFIGYCCFFCRWFGIDVDLFMTAWLIFFDHRLRPCSRTIILPPKKYKIFSFLWRLLYNIVKCVPVSATFFARSF